MTVRTRLQGLEAIGYALAKGLTLNKYADPIEGPRHSLTIDEAREIASEDPALIFLDIRRGPGRPRVEEKHPRLHRLLEAGLSDSEIAHLLGVCPASITRARKRLI